MWRRSRNEERFVPSFDAPPPAAVHADAVDSGNLAVRIGHRVPRNTRLDLISFPLCGYNITGADGRMGTVWMRRSVRSAILSEPKSTFTMPPRTTIRPIGTGRTPPTGFVWR